jgi:hypothetical protein
MPLVSQAREWLAISEFTSAPCLSCNSPAERIFFLDEPVYGLWDGYSVSPGHA